MAISHLLDIRAPSPFHRVKLHAMLSLKQTIYENVFMLLETDTGFYLSKC